MPRFSIVATLIATSINLAASSAAANGYPGQGYARDFTQHAKGSRCSELFDNHPYLTSVDNARVVDTFTINGSYYASRYHNRNPMASGNLYHECDTTVVAYNNLPLGTILRITNPKTGVTKYAVVQDTGGPMVSKRLDLSRGLIEALGQNQAENVGLLKGLKVERLSF